MGQRDIASFFGGKPAVTSASHSAKPAAKLDAKPAAGVKAAPSPAKASGTKRTASTQPAAIPAPGEADGMGGASAQQADGAASNVLRESNNIPAEVRSLQRVPCQSVQVDVALANAAPHVPSRPASSSHACRPSVAVTCRPGSRPASSSHACRPSVAVTCRPGRQQGPP